MGRYYHSNKTGDEGKFWFAVQPSLDVVAVYGMEYEEPPKDMENEEEEDWEDYGVSWADYYTNDTQYVLDQLNKQYDILGVPQEERKYTCYDVNYYIFHTIKKYFLTKEDNGKMGYSMGDEPTEYPISKEKELAMSRVNLGLFILNDLEQFGECSLNVEY